MTQIDSTSFLIRDPREWVADCMAQADCDIAVEAKDAFKQLAEEFEATATEIEGLISTFEALVRGALG